MELALVAVGIALTVIVVARLVEPLGIPVPLALLAVGIGASFLPGLPDLTLSPEVVLFGLLPPLLYAAAIKTSLLDLRTYRVAILSLSVGLVLFTALLVAVVTHALLPIPFSVAFALGAIVAPPDAVAATAVARSIGLPRWITTILEGESLLNDATALVTLRTAIAAAGLAAGHAQVSVASVGLDFLRAALGGVLIGWVVFVVVGWIRRRLTETAADTVLSYAVPFLAYGPAEQVHASGVLSVVTAGLLLAHKAPRLQTAPSRMSERINWNAVTFLLENAVFLLIGLQVSTIVDGVADSSVSVGRAIAVGAVVLLVCLAARPLWVIPFTWVASHRAGRTDFVAPSLIISWAGMRGVVTLAAALTLPTATSDGPGTPLRPVLVLIALVVTVGTLALQGFSLPSLARALGVRGPDPREDALVEATVIQAATAAGLRTIEADPAADAATVEVIRGQAEARNNRLWERLGTLGQSQQETPSEAYRRLRLEMIDAERGELLRIRDAGQVDHEVLTQMMSTLDAEETALTIGARRNARLRDSVLEAPERLAGACAHLQAPEQCVTPSTPEGCEECLRLGWTWVHLRMCTACGHVGCCDSSQGKHASAHFHDSTHPVMRSLEPGEAWRWCFVDEVLG